MDIDYLKTASAMTRRVVEDGSVVVAKAFIGSSFVSLIVSIIAKAALTSAKLECSGKALFVGSAKAVVCVTLIALAYAVLKGVKAGYDEAKQRGLIQFDSNPNRNRTSYVLS